MTVGANGLDDYSPDYIGEYAEAYGYIHESEVEAHGFIHISDVECLIKALVRHGYIVMRK